MAKLSNKIQNYSEADLIQLFNLNRLVGNESHPLLSHWMKTIDSSLDIVEQSIFDSIWQAAVKKIGGWHEEELKMQFLAFVLRLGNLQSDDNYEMYFERTVSATIKGQFLKTKTDFMYAKGILDKPQKPYFHFQEWKPQKNPTGDSMAQLLEAMLIAQEVNENLKPIYGCEVVGRAWVFVVLEGDTYCTSQTYDCTKKDDLLHIVAVLRHFKHILETKLAD
jgi:hypothetical protein